MTPIRRIVAVAAAVACLAVVGTHAQSTAQGSLTIGGSRANFGSHRLSGGFVPDPHVIQRIVSGGSHDVSRMGLGAGCTGFATRQPDIILHYSDAASFLRLYFEGAGDTALVINDGAGNWHCNDDTAGLNPQVDIRNPPSGQYDIWVASYEAGRNIRGALKITELTSNRVSE